MTFLREIQVLSRNAAHTGGVESSHALRGVDTEVFLSVDNENRGIPFSDKFVRGIVKRALSLSLIHIANYKEGLYNDDLSWEQTDQYDFGLDLDLFDSRLGRCV